MSREQRQSFLLAASSARAKLSPARRRATAKAAQKQPWLYPMAAERSFAKRLRERVLDPLAKLVSARLITSGRLAAWLKEARGDRRDSAVDELPGLAADLDDIVHVLMGTPADMKSSTMWALLTKAAGNVSAFNLRQWEKATERILGFPWRSPEHWWRDAEAAWAQENWRLLKRYEEDYIAGVT